MAAEIKTKGKQGFASMDSEVKRRISSMGGRTAHRLARAHTFTSEEAREAGRKGARVRLSRAYGGKMPEGEQVSRVS